MRWGHESELAGASYRDGGGLYGEAVGIRDSEFVKRSTLDGRIGASVWESYNGGSECNRSPA